jgi:PAS domain S-box-containing protein
MIALDLDEQRCEKCQKLLFRGINGFGLIEVKCSRCGHVNLLNSYDAMLRGTPSAYIIVYDKSGRLIATSKSAEKILGYTPEQLQNMDMKTIDPAFQLQTIKSKNREDALDEWVGLHKGFPGTVKHRTAEGTEVSSNARYYPIGTFTGVYTMCVFYASHI